MTAQPEQTPWATAPLLDPANIGRYVWLVWNSNIKQAQRIEITKIGRTNVHLASGESCRVHQDGDRGNGTKGGYAVSCHTEGYRLNMNERDELVKRLSTTTWRSLPIEVLRSISKMVPQ